VLAPVGSAGSSLTCQFTLVVASLDRGLFPDIVTVVGHDDEENIATDSADATATVVPVADLSMDKTVSQALTAGGTGAYTLAVHNDGPSNAEAVVISDTLPGGITATAATGDGWQCTIAGNGASVVCARPALAAGATAPVTVSVNVASTLNGQDVTNVANVGSSTKDDDPSNNQDSITSPAAATAVLPFTLARTGAKILLWTLTAGALMMLGLVVLYGTEVLPRHRRKP
jgi:uncharacterized repeat protein (TIGR01451 family)